MANETKSANIQVTAREIDFVTRFGQNWQALLDILGIMRPIEKVPGAVLKSKRASITLQSGSVAEAAEIPNSEASVVEIPYAEMSLEKYKKTVSIEAIKDHGYDVAVGMTDNAFLNQLQSNVMARFYAYLNTGELTDAESTFQAALAMAKGLVEDKFKKSNLNLTEVVGFANILDAYAYLGAANVTIQTMFGFNYIQNFMGYRVIFLDSAPRIPRGKVIATPVENIVNYYVNPANSDFQRAGLVYTTDGVTNLIGFHTEGAYHNATTENYALMGLVLFAEYIDGISVVDFGTSSLGAVTATSTAGTETAGDTVIKITSDAIIGAKYYFKSQASTAPAAPEYGKAFDVTGWTQVTDLEGTTISSTNGHKFRIVAVNGAGQAVATGDGTVAAKT